MAAAGGPSSHPRVFAEADAVLSGASLARAGQCCGVSATTVRRDLHDRLPLLDPDLAVQVRDAIEQHLRERASHGGQAFRRNRLAARAIGRAAADAPETHAPAPGSPPPTAHRIGASAGLVDLVRAALPSAGRPVIRAPRSTAGDAG